MKKDIDNKSILAKVNALLTVEQFHGRIVLHCNKGQIQQVERNQYEYPADFMQQVDKAVNGTGKNTT